MRKKLKIGNVQLDNNVIMAPMAGVSNESFRKIAKEFNVGLVCAEMLSDKAINFKNEKTIKMTKVSESEHPLSMQIFGSDIDSIVEAAKYLDKETDCDIIDFNMGCPVNKIVKNNAGSALMKDPQKAYKILKAIKESVDKPVTVKIRAGWDFDSINAVEVAKLMEKAGVDAITVHPRTKTQMYTGHSDWSIIKDVKESVNIPVIGNGDIKSFEDAKQMIEETNCDAIMIGRAAFGNPWLLKEVIYGLENKKFDKEVSKNEIYKYIIKHSESLKKSKGKKIANREMRSHIAWYISGLAYNKRIKDLINNQDSYDDVLTIVKKYFEILKISEKEEIKIKIDELVSNYKNQ